MNNVYLIPKKIMMAAGRPKNNNLPSRPGHHYKHYQSDILKHVNSIIGSVPAHRIAAKQQYSFLEKSFEEQLAIWNYVWVNSETFWIRIHAFFFLERNFKDKNKLLQMWPVIMHWQDSVNDWGLCDALAKIYTKILVVNPQEVYTCLQKWNKDENLWKRRQSVVSLLYYSRTKKDYPSFDKIQKLITPLLRDKEYYVQKGVGWSIRELFTVYPTETQSWFTQNIKSVSSIAFTIAIEKMNNPGKDKLKAMRKSK